MIARLRRTPGLTLRNHLSSNPVGTAPSLLSRFALRPGLATRAFLLSCPEVRVIWMVLSPGQIPLVASLMWGLRNRAGIVVEGASFGRYGDWWGAMRAMPAFFLLRAATTADPLARLSSPLAVLPDRGRVDVAAGPPLSPPGSATRSHHPQRKRRRRHCPLVGR